MKVLRWLEDVASIYAGQRAGVRATLFLCLLVLAALAAMIWTAVN